VHLRRIVNAERERRRELRAIAHDVAADLAGGRAPRVDTALVRKREADLRTELGRRS
jgi:hypothetical protein